MKNTDMTFAIPEGVRIAQSDDWRQLGDVIADAFREDPVMCWTFNHYEASRRAMQLLAHHVYLPRGECFIAESGGGAMWLPPGVSKSMTPLRQAQLAYSVVRRAGGAAIKRALVMDEAMLRHKPKEPHAYLFTIGVAQSGRGRGLGKKLMQPLLSAADQNGWPVYLENSNPRNQSFYNSFGFETLDVFQATDDAPPLEAMWRAPV